MIFYFFWDILSVSDNNIYLIMCIVEKKNFIFKVLMGIVRYIDSKMINWYLMN